MAGGNAMREVFARFGVDFDASSLVSGASATNDAITALQGLRSVVAGAALVGGLRMFAENLRADGVEIARTSTALGISRDALQEWRFVAQTTSGVAAEQLTPALQALRRNAAAAALGGAGMASDFRRLGVSLRGSDGQLRTTEELLDGVVSGLANIQDPTRRAGIAMRLLGEQGARLGPLFERGAEGVEEARARFRELGGGLSDETIEAAEEMTERTAELDAALLGLSSRIGVYILPLFTRTAEESTDLAAGFGHATENSRLLEAGMVTLGTAAAAAGSRTALAWARAALPFAAVGLAIAGLILIVDDLWVGFEGGESVLGSNAVAFEDWADRYTGALAPVVDLIETMLGGLREVAGFSLAAFGHATGDTELEATGMDLRSEGLSETAERVTRRSLIREGLITNEDGSPVEIGERGRPDLDFRSLLREPAPIGALSGGGGAGGARTTTIDRSFTMERGAIVINGMTEEAATRAVERGVAAARAAESDETLDDLAGGV